MDQPDAGQARREGIKKMTSAPISVRESPSVLPAGEHEWMRFPTECPSELPGAFLALLRLRGRIRSFARLRRKAEPVPLDRRTPTVPAKAACSSDREHRFFKRVCRIFPVTGPGQRNSKMCRGVLYLFERGLSAETITKITTFGWSILRIRCRPRWWRRCAAAVRAVGKSM